MARQILFVQGAGEDAHDGWDQEMVDDLQRRLGSDYAILFPHMPNEDDPHYPTWKTALLQEFHRLDDGAILVGHSIGATILFHTLADELPERKLGGLVLIAAAFIGEGGWPSDEIRPRTDFATLLPTGLPLFLYQGTDDDTVPPDHLELYARILPQAVIRRLPGRDHQLGNDLSEVARDIRSLDRDEA